MCVKVNEVHDLDLRNYPIMTLFQLSFIATYLNNPAYLKTPLRPIRCNEWQPNKDIGENIICRTWTISSSISAPIFVFYRSCTSPLLYVRRNMTMIWTEWKKKNYSSAVTTTSVSSQNFSQNIFIFFFFFSTISLLLFNVCLCRKCKKKKNNFPFFLLLNVEKMKKKKNRESIYTPKHKCKPCRRRHRIPFHSHPFHPEIIPCPTHPRTWT